MLDQQAQQPQGNRSAAPLLARTGMRRAGTPQGPAARNAETVSPPAGHAPDSNGEGWSRLLRFLAAGDDREQEAYERARNRLLQFFAARGMLRDEDLADATFDRVVAKLSDESAEQVRSPVGYLLRFAHFIYLEHVKSERARRRWLAALQFEDSDGPERAQERSFRDERLALLTRGLNELPPADRDLLLSYYTHDDGSRIASRQKLSLQLGIAPPLLRTRVSRLLATLNQRVRVLAEQAGLA
jgi:DNA-directed RNA polymerase specialized sigma24 family protein